MAVQVAIGGGLVLITNLTSNRARVSVNVRVTFREQ